MVGREALAGLDGYLAIVYGDGPLLRARDPGAAGGSGGRAQRAPQAAGVLLSAAMEDATGYGRVICRRGCPRARRDDEIVEQKGRHA